MNKTDTYFLQDDTYIKYYIFKNKNGSNIPPKHLMKYGQNEKRYIASGKRDYESLIKTIENNGFTFNQKRILEFGCNNARVLRHFIDHTKDNEIWGCDIDSKPVTWCQESLSPPFNFFVNTTQPSLPFKENYFDLIYAYSIFTHIDDLFFTWILELKRLISDTGLIFITLHDENSVNFGIENPSRVIGKHIQNNEAKFQQFLKGELNFLAINRNHQSHVFVKREYITERLNSFGLQVVDMVGYTMGVHQTGYLLKKI